MTACLLLIISCLTDNIRAVFNSIHSKKMALYQTLPLRVTPNVLHWLIQINTSAWNFLIWSAKSMFESFSLLSKATSSASKLAKLFYYFKAKLTLAWSFVFLEKSNGSQRFKADNKDVSVYFYQPMNFFIEIQNLFFETLYTSMLAKLLLHLDNWFTCGIFP